MNRLLKILFSEFINNKTLLGLDYFGLDKNFLIFAHK